MFTPVKQLKSWAILPLLALGVTACNSQSECQKYFSIPSEAIQCQRGADEVAPVVKGRFAVLPTQEQSEAECRSLCAEDLGGFSGSVDGALASELIDLQVACVKGCEGQLYYERSLQRAAASEGCEQIRIGGSIRCI